MNCKLKTEKLHNGQLGGHLRTAGQVLVRRRGGEFNNNAMRQMGEAIGCKMQTGAGYAAWMNGLNKRNHAVVDMC